MRFEVRAIDADHRALSMRLEALDEADAMTQARRRNLKPLSAHQQRDFGFRRAPSFSLVLFGQELHALLSAGLSAIEAIESLAERESNITLRVVLGGLATRLRQGDRLSGALQKQPVLFSPLFAGVVQAAEDTGDLPQALARYVDYESRLQTLRHRVISAVIYPAILLVVGSLVAMFLLGYVVPRFASVYEGTGRALPWASRLLLDWGQFVSHHAAWLIAGFGAAIAAILVFAARQLRDGGWWRTLQILPGARQRLEVLELSRLYLTLGMLLSGGIAIQRALQLARPVLAPGRRLALDSARGSIESGEPLSAAFESSGLSTPISLRLIRVGERSGQMGSMLLRAATFYEFETGRWFDRFSRTFEPVLMAAIGVVIGLIVILLYMPVFDMAGSLR